MELQLGKKTWVLREIVGTLIDKNKYTTRTDYVSRGPGEHAPVSISTHTKVHDNLVLALANGEEMPLRLWNVDLVAREGNVLHTVWIAPGGTEDFTLVALYNRASGTETWLGENLTKLFRLTDPVWKGMLIAFIAGCIAMVALGSLLPFLAPLWLTLPVLLPFLLWRSDKKSRAHVAELKALVHEGFESRRDEKIG